MNDAERRIRAYEEMGDHRTGREADNTTTWWMIEELRKIGVDAERQTWRFPRVEIHDASIRFGPWDIPAVPTFDSAFTDHNGLTGGLRRDNGPGIVVWEFGPDQQDRMAAGIYSSFELARQDGADGIILVMGDPDGHPVVRNAEFPLDPIALPVLQVAPMDAGPLLDAVGSEITLISDGGRVDAPADNVIATIPGAYRDAEPVVLMTPKSGWYTCAAERGGGIAIWLEVAGRIAASPGRRTLNIVASSGHELHHLGLEHYIRQLGDAASDVHAWMHLGASIGSRNGQPSYAASDDELFNVATDALNAQGLKRRAFPVGNAGYGEARNIGEIRGRVVSFLGGHPYFHSPQDTYDRCVDPESLTRHTDAVEQIVRYMLR
ncbi:MAG: M28 family peptidase [Chloroflexi bacterium]|nr:M28 family peptidase [Chloroflexota bacterium]